ncbi:chaperonin 10-like protein [Leucosporidium creatinivorum]|uniref:Chaperonin 10-like protein n=1 Tax=Leucosporidium creatinivorum TaxID=106004 RepID=A0A1Y2E684_9BASI|nr:chaperonin 10-like protein [Leucosporidium creatinivorum]
MSPPPSTTMKAARYYGVHDIRIEDVPIPQAKEGQCLVKVAWCGICGTDLHEYEAGPILCPSASKAHPITGETLPVCLGHEFSGIITSLGASLQGSWKVGDRVVVEPVISCHSCYACQHGYNNACTSLGFIGLSGYGGGLAEYIATDEQYLHKLPEGVSLQDGAMVEPLSVAMHAVEQAGMKKGDTALVLGAGPIGCFVIKTLIAKGASTVICSEPSSSRRRMATLAGATHVLTPPREGDIIAQVKALTEGNGVDVSFECAGVQATINTGIGALRPKGVCVNVAIWSIQPKIDMNALVLQEKTLKGVICYKNNHSSALSYLASGEINLDGFVTGTAALADVVEKGFKELINNNEQHVKILVSATGKEE